MSLDGEVDDGDYQGYGSWDTQELRRMAGYEIVCKTLKVVPPGFVTEFRG